MDPRKVSGAMAVVMALALPVTAYFEHLETKAYTDPVGIPTICYGHIQGVKLGDKKTETECNDMLQGELLGYAIAVESMVHTLMTPGQWAAFTSFSYNAGLGSLKKSSMLKKFQAGDAAGACNDLRKWVYAKGKKLNGLVKRREAERKLCLS